MNLEDLRNEEVREEKSGATIKDSSRAVKSCGESETPKLKKQCSFHQSSCDCTCRNNPHGTTTTRRSTLVPRNLCVEFIEVPSLKVLSQEAVLLCDLSSKQSSSLEVQLEDCVDKYHLCSKETIDDSSWNPENSEADKTKESNRNKSDMESPNLEKLSGSPEPLDNEGRRVVNMMCNIKPREEGPGLLMTILVRMDDKMNRQLSCVVDETDTPLDLASELVDHGFIHEADRDKLAQLIEDSIYTKLNSVISRSSSSASAVMMIPGAAEEDYTNHHHQDMEIDTTTTSTSEQGAGIMFYPLHHPPASSSLTINSVS